MRNKCIFDTGHIRCKQFVRVINLFDNNSFNDLFVGSRHKTQTIGQAAGIHGDKIIIPQNLKPKNLQKVKRLKVKKTIKRAN